MENTNVMAQLQELIAANQPEAVVDAEVTMQYVDGMGKTCLLIGTICMALSTAYFYMAAVGAKENKFFESVTMMITGIATLAYLSMYSGVGYMWGEEYGTDELRPVYYARYIDWILTTPLMVWDVLALAGAASDEVMLCVGVDMLMIGFGVIGAQTPGGMKWPFFVVGCLAYVHVVQTLMKFTGYSKYGEAARKLYERVAMLTIGLWTFYPVVWILAEGTRTVSPNVEALFYMVLDVLSKCVFGLTIVNARSALAAVTNPSETQPLMQKRNNAA